MLALYPRTDLIKDANVPDTGGPSPVEFSLGYLTKSRREVDALVRQATAAGARVTEPPHDRAWESTRAISRIPMGTCGRSSTTAPCLFEMTA